ncbi:MAG TPA: NFACT RNA binding domain-containing protein [Abditibacteriaceae bacterium]|jgi:predicted ribosome quality control (RQC) complex YloA/Tae2 family protein
MIFDSLMMAAVAHECESLVGARVREVWTGCGTRAEAATTEDSEPRALFLLLSTQSGHATLVIDTHPQRARLHLVQNAPQGGTPSPFSDAARRALRGARLVSIEQPHFDRALHFRFQARDAIGNAKTYTLVAELMNRRSNAVLIDENNTIIDALKRLPPFLNRARTVLPHRPYQPPPGSRQDPRAADWPALLGTVEIGPASDEKAWRELLGEFNGISPLVLKHLRFAVKQGEMPQHALETTFALPTQVFLCGNQPYPLDFGDCQKRDESLSELLEEYAERAAAAHEDEGRRAALSAHLARLEARVVAQRADLERARAHATEADAWQEQGTLVLSHLREVGEAAARGEEFVELPGENGMLRIAIEPKWPPADNATRLFNRAKRARKLAEAAPGREAQLDEEAARLTHLRERLVNADAREVETLADEMGWESGPKIASRSRQLQAAARPESKLRRVEVAGWTCVMGRNAEENQMLLSKVARPSDIWLHLSGRPSAHVLVKNQKGKTPPPEVLDEAARWLASTSLSRKASAGGERVEVIYTPAKWVRSVKGAPGKVTLQRHQTRLVTI